MSRVIAADEDLNVLFFTNSLVDAENVYYISVSHKEKEIFNEQISLQPSDVKEMTIPASKIDVPNGAVLTVNLFRMDQALPAMENEKLESKLKYADIVGWYQFKGESTFFVKPAETVSITVDTDKEEYRPGDDATVSVSTDSDTDIYISVVVTDESVFSKIPYRVQPPSLASAIYLEHEVKHSNYQFYYANEYINHLFEEQSDDSSDANLDLLLGVQQWRRQIYCLDYIMDSRDKVMKSDDPVEKQRL